MTGPVIQSPSAGPRFVEYHVATFRSGPVACLRGRSVGLPVARCIVPRQDHELTLPWRQSISWIREPRREVGALQGWQHHFLIAETHVDIARVSELH